MKFLKMKKSWSFVRFLIQTTSVCTWEHEWGRIQHRSLVSPAPRCSPWSRHVTVRPWWCHGRWYRAMSWFDSWHPGHHSRWDCHRSREHSGSSDRTDGFHRRQTCLLLNWEKRKGARLFLEQKQHNSLKFSFSLSQSHSQKRIQNCRI